MQASNFATTVSKETEMKVKSPKNPPETIIDKTPKTPFTSPLQKFIIQNCQQCTWWKGKCRLDDTNGIARMKLCMLLSVSQPPPNLAEIIQKATETQKISEKTMQEATAEAE